MGKMESENGAGNSDLLCYIPGRLPERGARDGGREAWVFVLFCVFPG